MSYIKRKDAKNAIFDYICEQTVSKYPSVAECKAARSGAEGAFNEIDYVPTADVVEVRHGEWGFDGTGWTCSECDGYGGNRYKYCPHCGAKMDAERREE